MTVTPGLPAVVYALHALVKGFSVFYFVLLPVFYATGVIDTKQLGYIGALFIGLVIAGALVVARWLHDLPTKRLLRLSAWCAVGASTVLLVASMQRSLALITVSFAMMGLVAGVGMSAINALVAGATTRGDRFGSLAKLSMLTDGLRIVFPVMVAGVVALWNASAGVLLALIACLVTVALTSKLPTLPPSQPTPDVGADQKLRRNKPFRYILSLEFLDSLASSQLFVFLPIVFLARGHSLESSLVLQSFVFIGYLSGRWVVGRLAKLYSGPRAIAGAEIGMVISIVALLLARQLWLLYVLSFLLGLFARGTSPAIKALAFDSLGEHQMKQGSAVHVVAGDSGSALGQLLFGFLVAWYGVNAPFIVAAVLAGLIAIACLYNPKVLLGHETR